MKHRKAANAALWILQALLATLFLFAGTFKLTMSAGDLVAQTGLPAPFMQFVSLAELAGGLGLLLPGLVRVRQELTPIAAAALILIMVGAVVVSARRVSIGAAAMPVVVGVLLATVALGRRRWVLSISRRTERRRVRRVGTADGRWLMEDKEVERCA